MKHRTLFVVLFFAAAAALAALTARWPAVGSDAPPPPSLPMRTSTPTPIVVPPPPLPSGAHLIPRWAFTVETTVRSGVKTDRTEVRVLRTVDRIHLEIANGRKEWLFERNSRDPGRVSAYLTDHDARTVLTYEESDLRNEQRLRGWADVLMMRFDPAVLATLRATGRRRTIAGEQFEQFVARDRSADGVREVWWSQNVLLPLRVRTRHGQVISTSVVARFETPSTVIALSDPRQRYPAYKAMDVTDARDQRH